MNIENTGKNTEKYSKWELHKKEKESGENKSHKRDDTKKGQLGSLARKKVSRSVADPNTEPPNVGETMFQKHWTTDLEETNQHWTTEQCSRNTPTTNEEKKKGERRKR